ncbi:MAG: hypothetical protein LBQ69_01515 [Treponema sp.]|jgi:hypothetical protein|nr:hypothetical protein [Treponema sp.]
MKTTKQMAAVLTVMAIIALIGCASKPNVRIVELENKGTAMKVGVPGWIKTYTENGISRVQAQSEFKDMYCVVGEESGVNRQFVLAWADNFSAQQRIGAMLRTTITSEYQARVQGAAQSQGGAGSSTAAGTASGEYGQEIDSAINAIVNVSYSGAQREADWWSLRRRYDPDQEGVYTDEYTAYVLYTIPKSQLNQQIARALETAISADSALYDITIQLARDILLKGFNYLGEGDLAAAGTPTQTPEEIRTAGLAGNITIRNNSSATSSVMSAVKIYSGYEIKGDPFMVYDNPVLGGQQVSWELPEGIYTVAVFLNDREESIGSATVGVTARSSFIADFWNGSLSSFTKKK